MRNLLTLILIALSGTSVFAGTEDKNSGALGQQIFWSTQLPNTDNTTWSSIDLFSAGASCAIYNRPLLVVQAAKSNFFQLSDTFAYYSMITEKVDNYCGSDYSRSDLAGRFTHEYTDYRGDGKEHEYKEIRTLTKLGRKIACPLDLCKAGSNELLPEVQMVHKISGLQINRVEFFDGGFVVIGAQDEDSRGREYNLGVVLSLNVRSADGLSAELKRRLAK